MLLHDHHDRNDVLAPLHSRMLVILAPDACAPPIGDAFLHATSKSLPSTVADRMNRAFVKEDDADPGVVPLPNRPISPHRNLVTRRGLRLMESKVAQYENDLARAIAAADREAVGRAARELRYWTARLASAEVAEPDPEADHVVFGMAVTVLREDETEANFRIVGRG
jgi:transcription elongation GreA/GreB family factor